ncbi:hypothetical protein Syun_000519 [Stephania yunnanensis]|uniref:DYW domain-containing protein n=1 Tax=Stephania yunnanensis TaxID=152371 RepID=A0AAP0LHQ0_9MAGN
MALHCNLYLHSTLSFSHFRGSHLPKQNNIVPTKCTLNASIICSKNHKFPVHFEESELGIGGTSDKLGETEFVDMFTQSRSSIHGQCISLIHALNQCANQGNLVLGQSYHALVIKKGLAFDKFAATAVAGMYAKCGEVEDASKLFDQCPDMDIVSWNNLILGYAINGFFDRALNLFVQVQKEEIGPNAYTFSIVIGACATSVAVNEGKQIHGLVVKMHYSSNTVVNNSLLTMYCKFGMMDEVEILFKEHPSRNHITWTAIITGFYRQECFEKALWEFHCMRHSEVAPNERTFAVALASSGGMRDSSFGTMLHALTIKNGMAARNVFVGTAILDMYSAVGEMGSAEKQLDEMNGLSSINVPWNALIAGHVSNGENEDAMEALNRMLDTGIECDEFTYSNILKAASSLPSLAAGEQIHSCIIKTKYEANMHVASSLVEMYTNCGILANAERVFNQMREQDVVSWNSMVKAYSQHGHPNKAILLFHKMAEGIRPTSATFVSVISACSHSGLVEEGLEHFKTMLQYYEITPEEAHYCCIVDLLGRAGRLEEARDFINNSPIEPSASIWRPLLAASRQHHNLQMAEFAAEQILREDFSDPTVHVTLSNMYAKEGRWSDAEKQRNLMKLKDVEKEPGSSWVEANRRLYKFYSRDKKLSEMPEVYAKLEELVEEIRTLGYVPDTKLVHTQRTDEASKQQHILLHSEKLAVCFGLISLSPNKPIRVFKNIRVCSDCHSAMKYISIATSREIVLRDNYRFHCFKQGCCSCGDYW